MNAETATPLLCAIGRHAPEAMVLWNHGYYFTTCRRCRRDLVRTAYGAWHMPRGYRVVWQAYAPAGTMRAELAPLDMPSRASRSAAPVTRRGLGERELPITEVLRHLANTDVAEEVAERPPKNSGESSPAVEPEDPAAQIALRNAPPSAAPDESAQQSPADAPAGKPQAASPDGPEADEATLSEVADFMDDGRHEAPADPAIAPSKGEGAGIEPEATRAAAIPAADKRAGPAHEANRNPVLGAIIAGRHTFEFPSPAAVAHVALGVAATLLLVVTLLIFLQPLPDRIAGPTAASLTRPALPAFVSARVLNCRSAPAIQARTVRRLARGEQVQLVAREGDWISLVYDGGQCWALATYLSRQRPY